MPGLRLQSGGVFGHKTALRGNLRGQISVFLWVDHIHPARHHRHGSRGQRRLMRRRIDAARQARDHHLPGRAQPLRQPSRHAQPQGGGIARPHNRHHRALQQARVAPRPKHRRRIGQIHQTRRIARPTPEQKLCATGPPRLDLGLRHAQWANLIPLNPGGARQLRQRLQRRAGRPMLAHQPVKGHRPHAARPDQPQPIGRIVPLGSLCCGACHGLPRGAY